MDQFLLNRKATEKKIQDIKKCQETHSVSKKEGQGEWKENTEGAVRTCCMRQDEHPNEIVKKDRDEKMVSQKTT